MKSATGYTHHKNRDGRIDSICLRCFQTVASGRREEYLNEREDVHTCETGRISFVKRLTVRAIQSTRERRFEGDNGLKIRKRFPGENSMREAL